MPMLWNGTLSFHQNSLYDLLLKTVFMIGGLYATYKSHTMITGLFSRQAEGMEKETVAMGMQMLNMAKDVVMLPANIIKDEIKEEIDEKVGGLRSAAAQGISNAFKGGGKK
jgi:hypothetical protein